MGCSISKLDDEEAVQLCKDRKKFIKQAVEQRARFASGHLAYIHSLKRVSAALRDYIEGDNDNDNNNNNNNNNNNEPREFLLDSSSFVTPPMKKKQNHENSGFISISPKSLPKARIREAGPTPKIEVNYLRSGGGNPSVSVEERPSSPERVRFENYYSFSPMQQQQQQFGFESSSFFSYSPNRISASYNNNNGNNIPPPSPRNSQWDFFWNPFSSLDNYGYPSRASVDLNSFDHGNVREEEGIRDLEDDIRGLRRVREEEGIPDLEDDIESDECDKNDNFVTHERDYGFGVNIPKEEEEVLVEDVDEEEEEEEEEQIEAEIELEATELQQPERRRRRRRRRTNIEISRSQTSKQVETTNGEKCIGDSKRMDEMPGFTVYVNRRPTSMAEVIKELEDNFMVVCSAANEVSSMLEAHKAQYSSLSSELTVKKILNPVALIRSASSRSSSSRFANYSSSSGKEETGGEESSSDISEECMFSGSHQSTLDRLYAWEKKLYDEVRAGEKVRIAYEKKCMQLRNHDVKGDDPSSVEKTRSVLRDLHTRIKVSIHSVEAISKRIQTLRDEELQPQLLELVNGLSRMWKVMAECHKSQKRTLDEAKLLLAGTPSKLESKRHSTMSVSEPQRVARSASSLESELRNWRACFESWIASQRSYALALASWLLRCAGPTDHDPEDRDGRRPRSSFSSSSAGPTPPPIFGLCAQWSRSLEGVREAPVLDGLDFFAAGMGSLYHHHQREDHHHHHHYSRRAGPVSKGFLVNQERVGHEVVEIGREEDNDDVMMSAEKMAEVAIRVLCAGMSVAMSSLAEFSVASAKGYGELVGQWESAKRPPLGIGM